MASDAGDASFKSTKVDSQSIMLSTVLILSAKHDGNIEEIFDCSLSQEASSASGSSLRGEASDDNMEVQRNESGEQQ